MGQCHTVLIQNGTEMLTTLVFLLAHSPDPLGRFFPEAAYQCTCISVCLCLSLLGICYSLVWMWMQEDTENQRVVLVLVFFVVSWWA